MPRTRTTARNEQRTRAPKWTAQEEEIILDEIGKSPTNVKVALLAAAERLPVRSFYACSNHWYAKMANREDLVGKLTISRYATVRNKVKVPSEQEDSFKKTHTRSVWNNIITFLFGRGGTNG